MNRDAVLDVYRTHLAAERAHDYEAAAATYVEDGYYDLVPLGLHLAGRDAVALNYALSYVAMPDVDFEIEAEVVDGDRLVHWGALVGTVTGDYLGQAPTGRPVRLPFVAAFEFRDGHMLGERLWFDLATLCDQAGFDLHRVRTWADEIAAALATPGTPT